MAKLLNNVSVEVLVRRTYRCCNSTILGNDVLGKVHENRLGHNFLNELLGITYAGKEVESEFAKHFVFRPAREVVDDSIPFLLGNTSPSDPEILSFDDALALAIGRKHLMLGNGFSIALFPRIFTYRNLFEKAQEAGKLTERIADVFGLLKTTDFEQVMKSLQDASVLMEVYAKENASLAKRLRKDAERLQDVLAETISENHPNRPYEISDLQYASCRHFLSHFDGNIYTLNYDLLLYWTLMHEDIAPSIEHDDGFRTPEDGVKEYVTWDVQNTNRQRVYYLHGALHIYDAGAELLKFTWKNTDIALVDQIRDSLRQRHYPLIVTEGTSKQKKNRIQHSNFLGRAFRSFSSIEQNLFVHGHSLAKNDEHLLKLVDGGKVKRVFVGLHGNPSSESNRQIVERARCIPLRRSNHRPAEVFFYDALSAQVWDRPVKVKNSSTKKPR